MTDMSDMLMQAAADVQEMMMDFMREQNETAVAGKVRGLWMQLPDEMKEKFKKDNPEAYRAFMDSLKRK